MHATRWWSLWQTYQSNAGLNSERDERSGFYWQYLLPRLQCDVESALCEHFDKATNTKLVSVLKNDKDVKDSFRVGCSQRQIQSHAIMGSKKRIQSRAVASEGAVVPLKICALHFTFGPRLLHASNIVFLKCGPPSDFWTPCCEILATGWYKVYHRSAWSNYFWPTGRFATIWQLPTKSCTSYCMIIHFLCSCEWWYSYGKDKVLCSSQCWLCANTVTVMCADV